MTEWGYKTSQEDLTDFLREIGDCESPPDIAFTQRVTALMQQNVSGRPLRQPCPIDIHNRHTGG